MGRPPTTSVSELVDDATAYQIAIPVESTSEGFSGTVYLDLIEFREGDLLVGVQTVDVLPPVHEDVAHLEHRQVCVSSATRFDATEMKVVTEPSPLMSGSVA